MGTSITIALSAYVAVVVAELAGDRTIYALGSLAGEIPALRLFAAASAALSVKILVATLAGNQLSRAPPLVVRCASLLGFLVAAALLIRRLRSDAGTRASTAPMKTASLGAFLSAIAIEWADPGQLAAASLAARSHQWFSVWIGGSLAMATKAAIGIVLGLTVRRWLPLRPVRLVAIASCVAMGLMALFD